MSGLLAGRGGWEEVVLVVLVVWGALGRNLDKFQPRDTTHGAAGLLPVRLIT